MSDKKKFTVYVGSVALCVGVAVLLHYVSFTNPYLQSICHLLRPFIYIGLYLVWQALILLLFYTFCHNTFLASLVPRILP